MGAEISFSSVSAQPPELAVPWTPRAPLMPPCLYHGFMMKPHPDSLSRPAQFIRTELPWIPSIILLLCLEPQYGREKAEANRKKNERVPKEQRWIFGTFLGFGAALLAVEGKDRG